MIIIAKVHAETLTDNSTAHNVRISAGDGAQCIIGACSEQHARSIADAINAGAAWVMVRS